MLGICTVFFLRVTKYLFFFNNLLPFKLTTVTNKWGVSISVYDITILYTWYKINNCPYMSRDKMPFKQQIIAMENRAGQWYVNPREWILGENNVI